MSRKERLRKEVMAAREMEVLQQQQSSDTIQVQGADREAQRDQEKNVENKISNVIFCYTCRSTHRKDLGAWV